MSRRIVITGGASVLALEAERVMAVEQEKLIEMADKAKLAITCV